MTENRTSRRARRVRPGRSDWWEPLGAFALYLLTAIFTALLSAKFKLFFLCLSFLAGVGALAWILKKDQWKFRLFFIFYSVFEWLHLTGQATLLHWRITFLGRNPLLVGIGVTTGLLGTAVWFWLCRLGVWGKKWSKDWQTIFLAAVIGIWSFQLGLDLAYDVNALADTVIKQQIQVIVEDVFSERFSWGHSDSYIYYVRLQENELTKAGEAVGLWHGMGLAPGDRVQLVLHPGALGVPWLECVAGEGSP